jgi:hypothetical protein
VVKAALYCLLVVSIATSFGVKESSISCFWWCCHWSGPPGRSIQFGRRCYYPGTKAFCGGRLYY